MNRKIIKQNKTFLLASIILLILFVMVLYFGCNQIYESEARRRHDNARAQLLSVTGSIKIFFSDFRHDRRFLMGISSAEGYINSDFKSAHYRKETEEIFHKFVKAYDQYYQIRIIDSSGQEIIRIDNRPDNNTAMAVEPRHTNWNQKHYFRQAMKLPRDRIYASPIDLNIDGKGGEADGIPVIRLASPLFDSKNTRKGVMILDMYLSEILALLPENMFIQTAEGNIMSLKPDGSLDFRKSEYNFKGSSGRLDISDTESIHYSTVEFLPGKKLIVAISCKHPLLKMAMEKLVLISGMLLALFLGLISVIVYMNIQRFRELIGAQKTTIFALAELAEWRDPETGYHLERTRNYAVVLARQLRKNRKYRQVITDDFIEELYDAAPLHDIGKVGIRDSVLLKEGELTAQEYEEMKKHVLIGKQVLQDAIEKFNINESFILVGKNICAYHHEKYNGKGYPEGLKGEEIPLEARIFALCDAYDAIRTRRPYKGRLSHEEAVRRIVRDSGEHFDPDIVDAFLRTGEDLLDDGTLEKDQTGDE